MFEVELRFFQGKTIIFREEKIVGRIRLILEGDSFFKGAPFRRPGFLSIAIVTGMSSSSNRKKVATTFICEENASSPKSAIINHPFWMPFASYGTNTQ